ncbi:hypothetical protein VI26_20460 [Chromobacterium sp. LK1]|uniref:GPW/gp25 family protein n=1 Tax=Chromobacterium sp. LK1 TaxID=1628193 RepID=UPI000654BADC|nr:GPW/gp25 family protein [Chromobacterium sp. LK1]KMN30873.1 hypothetical protein VI26_20460 [Chromobacterium sp. LK1]
MTPRLYDQLSARSGRDALAASLARELTHLMNAALRGARLPLAAGGELTNSVWNYGQPPLAEGRSSQIDPARVSTHIRAVIRGFEPRLDPASIEVSARSGTGALERQRLYFDIAAIARDGGAALRFSLTLDYLDAYFSLPRAAETGADG